MSTPDEAIYPPPLAELEAKRIAQRRSAALAEPDLAAPAVGVGLSGGGIRSATFAFGVFQALARQGLVRRIDFLSTVSGGGYFGAFLGRLFGRPYVREGRDGMDDVEAALAEKPGVFEKDPESRKLPLREPTRALRENGRYLAPNGGGDYLLAGAVLLRNWLVVQFVVWVSLASLFVVVHAARRGLVALIERSGATLPRLVASTGGAALILALVLVGFWIVPAGWGYWMVGKRRVVPLHPGQSPEENLRSLLRARTRGPLVVSLVALAGAAVCWFLCDLAPTVKWIVAATAVITSAAGWIARPSDPAARPESIALIEPWAAAIALPLATSACWFGTSDVVRAVGAACFEITLLALLNVSIVMLLRDRQGALEGDPHPRGPAGNLRWCRNLLSRWLANGLFVAALFVLFAGVAWASRQLWLMLHDPAHRTAVLRSIAASAASVSLAMGFAKRVVLRFGGEQSERPSLPPALLATVVALLLGFAVLVGSDLLARLLLDDADALFPASLGHAWTWIAVATALLLSAVMGHSMRLLNLSSQHTFYAQRLTRAWLGASNPARIAGGVALTESLKSDDAMPAEYWRHDRGAPLHLINVTINETFAGKSQVEQRDRKGLALAVGPCGLSAGTRNHALIRWSSDPAAVGARFPPGAGYRVFDERFWPQTLTIGEWVGISGAAFSTGIGSRTNLGMSFLCGFANVRLGFWWDAHVRRGAALRGMWLRRQFSRVLPLQSYLLNEFRAQFPGTAWGCWYLSDGGHFENLGGYELIRRKLKCILLVDGEQDADYGFEGLGNLVRLARVDFEADIRFLDEAELDVFVHQDWRGCFGSLDHLRRGRWSNAGDVPEPLAGRARASLDQPGAPDRAGHSLAHAALARVRYADGAVGVLLYVKTTLVGDEPIDLTHYHTLHDEFPHESTADQFFDEPQWESYRMLGDHIASKLFDPARRRPRAIGSPPIPAAATGSFEPEELFRGVVPRGFDQLP